MSLRARIFLMFVAVAGAGFYLLVDWVQDDLRPRYLESLEEPLVDMANLLAEIVAARWASGQSAPELLGEPAQRAYDRRLRARIHALEKTRVDLRVYVTDARGIVVFDSDAGRDLGKDYSRWNDVHRTLRGEYGARSSHGDPLHPEGSVMYVAAPVHVQGRLAGVVSVGKPTRMVDLFLADARQRLWQVGLLAVLAVVGLALVLSLWINRPLRQLAEYASKVSRGERVRLPKLGANEVATVGSALEAMRASLDGRSYVEQYVQTLTHELKSPLAAIRGAAELLQEEMPPGDRARFLRHIGAEVGRIQDLVERLLELSALENRKALDDPQPLDVDAVLGEVSESLRPLALAKTVSFVKSELGPLVVRGEPFLIRQALGNLLRNALAFSPGNGVVEIRAERRDGQVVVEIADRGPGIPHYALGRVFERFFSTPRPDSGARGTGLGLSFVKEVAELHGGRVSLENRPEGGAIATLRLPAADLS